MPRAQNAHGFRQVQVRDALLIAGDRIGGVERLVAWIKSEPYREDIFWRDMYMKLLPLQIESHTTITHEQALDELERRFPRFIDGKPVNYAPRLKAPHVAVEDQS
jgi:hypothetical protein